jgi:hypothetical protein
LSVVSSRFSVRSLGEKQQRSCAGRAADSACYNS